MEIGIHKAVAKVALRTIIIGDITSKITTNKYSLARGDFAVADKCSLYYLVCECNTALIGKTT